MIWRILIPILIAAWGIMWYVKSKSLPIALTVVARISLILGLVYFITELVWGFFTPQGVCPQTTSLPRLLLSLTVPVVALGLLFYLATWLPQVIKDGTGTALLAGEDILLTEPFEIETLDKNKYLITSGDKEHKVTLRGKLGKSAIEELRGEDE